MTVTIFFLFLVVFRKGLWEAKDTAVAG